MSASRVSTRFGPCWETHGCETYEEAETEDSDETELLPPAEVETAECREWQQEDDDVGDDVPSRVDVPEWEVGDTGAGRVGEPELMDWRASKDDDKEL